jgi:hypothetical protein
MPLSFTKDDLLLPPAEVAAVTKKFGSEARPDPISEIVTSANRTVETYTARYAIDADWARRLVRALAFAELMRLLERMNQTLKDAENDTLKELRDIRDGKFPDLQLAAAEDAPTPAAGQTGNWGSGTRIFPR